MSQYRNAMVTDSTTAGYQHKAGSQQNGTLRKHARGVLQRTFMMSDGGASEARTPLSRCWQTLTRSRSEDIARMILNKNIYTTEHGTGVMKQITSNEVILNKNIHHKTLH